MRGRKIQRSHIEQKNIRKIPPRKYQKSLGFFKNIHIII